MGAMETASLSYHKFSVLDHDPCHFEEKNVGKTNDMDMLLLNKKL
jgi:hypothetical protein